MIRINEYSMEIPNYDNIANEFYCTINSNLSKMILAQFPVQFYSKINTAYCVRWESLNQFQKLEFPKYRNRKYHNKDYIIIILS